MVFRRINWPNFLQFKQWRQIGPCVLFVKSKIFHYCEYKHPWRSSQRVTSGDVTVDVYTLFLQRQKWQSKFRMHIIQCPYTYEHKQHISKKCNGIASISNSLLAAVVKVAKCFTWRSLDSVFSLFANLSMTACAFTGISRWMCKSACPVSRPRPSLMRDLNHVSSLLRVEKQSWCDKFVIWEAFIRPWNRKIGKTGYQKTLQRPLKGGGRSPPPPPPLWIRQWAQPYGIHSFSTF